MNCKQGDLAIVIKSSARNEGKIVRCLKLHPKKLVSFPDGIKEVDVWELDQKFVTFTGSLSNLVPDDWLKPIRDQYGEDEMIKIAGYPKVKEAQ